MYICRLKLSIYGEHAEIILDFRKNIGYANNTRNEFDTY